MDAVVLLAIPLFLVLIGIELAFSQLARRGLFETRDTLACLAMGLGNVAVNIPWKLVVVAMWVALWPYRVFEFPATAWWSWLALLVAEDFCYYWFHRFHHESRIGWAAHVNHHSSGRYNLAVALRQSWTTPFTGVLFWLPLPLLGFHPLMILTQQGISLIYQFWLHTQTIGRLGPLEYLFNTPSHHRVHHGTNPQYIDRNYGGILIVWDRLFGTFQAEDEAVRFGIVKPLASYNPFIIAFHEWRAMLSDAWRAATWADRLQYLVRHPGWMPGRGSR